MIIVLIKCKSLNYIEFLWFQARNHWNVMMNQNQYQYIPGLILGLHPANERPRYFVTKSLIGWAQAQNQPWLHAVSSKFYTMIMMH